MNTMNLVTVGMCLAFSVAACDKGGDGSSGASSQAPTTGSAATVAQKQTGTSVADPAKGWTKLEKVGLQIDVPGMALVLDGMGEKSALVTGPETGGINVAEAGKSDPKTLKAAQEDAKLFNAKNEKTETLSDGWVYTWQNTGSMGTNFWVTVRREIGGKAIMCTNAPDSAAKSAATVAACKSLKP